MVAAEPCRMLAFPWRLNLTQTLVLYYNSQYAVQKARGSPRVCWHDESRDHWRMLSHHYFFPRLVMNFFCFALLDHCSPEHNQNDLLESKVKWYHSPYKLPLVTFATLLREQLMSLQWFIGPKHQFFLLPICT